MNVNYFVLVYNIEVLDSTLKSAVEMKQMLKKKLRSYEYLTSFLHFLEIKLTKKLNSCSA